ncbi:type I restriction endonuclease subunit R [Acinetobacter towneri]|uniref:Type I restriction enzyme endonuclease subunit n=1 Tax=Acinetobacter towneri TaxID=202956 RepID=A0AB35LYP8_9GAMM|nr:type I restriction endonuclease subunit R [Acinetobacter towneri]MDM1717950.1 type I restriction endonuclease subunit R [Acinetobacter towneri]MDM1730610.1 type I restriction endonuclease subunit R [Acinetobacter towneri]MDM1733237.1 type I restriction endonuclease subunit R [Acinetobacter towneri]MDM1735681.1 type I restriction endonuclease subunit R [Acinetobacter towneri]MDM1738146.1 type I restriction endonuclease subunit R [Acinetobacter towneri]
MTVQSEYQLENELIGQLKQLGYATVSIKDESQLLSNLKTQIERTNGLAPLSTTEWKQVISFLNTGTVFERAKNLRDLFPVKFDDGSSKHIFFLSDDPSKNIYQVTNQITIDHRDYNGRTSRFDVTLLVNGLPLVQIELKKRGMEIAEAFNQTQRYIREAYWAGQGLFGFIQLFVISNGANTRYYSNGTTGIEFAFPWADVSNKHINEIVDFADAFLNQQHLTQMLTQYMVLLETTKSLMVLRPYQIYAVQKIVEHVQSSDQNGYIWHTTGSGKTLTSFKASQIIMQMLDVEKVLFVVDRNDLDTQTSREFNAFKADSVDSTDSTHTLVKQLDQRHDKLIVTTIQKLNRAISNDRYAEYIDYLKDKKVVFIFDECHRSQFGDTHQNIKKFFSNAQMFGFTGTPIFEKNSQSKAGLKLTTDYLFNECLHKYVIVDAIRDRNVLQFQIDYRGKYTAKGMQQNFDYDDEVEGIDTQELYDNPQRLEMIARYIVNIHDTKTRNREFTAMFCVSSVDVLTQYYELFEKVQAAKQIEDEAQGRIFKPLTIATIFSYSANQSVPNEDLNGLIDEEAAEVPSQVNQSNRDKLDRYIAKYNQQFNTNYNSGDQFYSYYRDIADRVKKRQIDILLVVNMFLTGFDSKPLNTLYVDKNLKYHGLIQAFSRTNRVYNDKKPFGNIICFRNLKRATDEALALFSNKEAKKVVLVPSFDEIKKDYEEAISKLFSLTPDYKSVDDLVTEEQQLEFIKAFREVMRYNAQLQTFIEYDQDQTQLDKQHFANFASKYADLCRAVRKTTKKEKVSVLDDVDFQLDLLHSDRINVGYIINLLQLVVDTDSDEKRQKYQAQIYDLISSDISLHDKQDLIQKFIEENMPKMINGQSVKDAFAEFWDAEKEQAYQHLCEQENLKPEEMKKVLENYEFTQRLPRKEELKDLPNFKVKLFERENVFSNLLAKTRQLIEKFYVGFT